MTPFAITEWIKGILAGAIMSNLSGLFDSVNEQVGTSPADFEPRVFEMIRGGSNSAILPIADVFLNLVACYALVQMVTEHKTWPALSLPCLPRRRYPKAEYVYP